MTYEEARSIIREAARRGSVLGLDSIRHLMHVLGDVQRRLNIIHIAGTNGKGSVGAYLESIFRCHGLRVGRYSSPAVFSPLEQWTIDGYMIQKAEYARVMSQVKATCDIVASESGTMPTVFEMETAAAFLYFAKQQPDIVLLETGMGGIDDATNIINKPLCSVFTTISYDHMHFLGDTLSEIAAAKAGIIKEGCRVFSSPQQPEAETVIERAAGEKHAELKLVRESDIRLVSLVPGRLEFTYQGLSYQTAMAGLYQMRNASLAIETAQYMLPRLGKTVSQRLITEGIASARWEGRFEVLGYDPLFVIDGAHNEDAAKQLADTVEKCFTNGPLTYIIGVLADKEHEKMLQIMLPYASQVYCVTPDNSRALSGELLCVEARRFHEHAACCGSIADAVRAAVRTGDPVLAFGSLSYLGELRRCYEALYGGLRDD